MIKSKSIEIIKHLNKEEFHRLEKFLASPFFNTNKNLIKLYKILKKFYPEFNSPAFTKEDVFNSVFENQVYNDAKSRKLFSELYKELDKFLVILHLEKDRITYNKLSLDILNSKKLDKMFIDRFEEVNVILDREGVEINYFLEKYLLQSRFIDFHLLRGEQYKICKNIFDRSNYLIVFFLSDLFVNLQDIYANRTSFNFYYEPNLPEEFLNDFNIESFLMYIEKNKLKQKEMIELYYYVFLSFTNFSNESYYYKLKKIVIDNLNKFSRENKYSTIQLLMNYCIQKTVLQGKGNFEAELNELYRIYINNKLYKTEENSYISTSIFLFMLNNYLIAGKVEEAGRFLKKNLADFHPKYRENMVYYYNALLNFKEKQYDNALREISLIKTISFIFRRSIKVLLLKIYFEMNLYDKAKETANNYRKFLLHDKTISETYKKIALEFLKMYEGLLKIKFKSTDSYSIDKLKRQANESVFRERLWIEEKLAELEKQIV